MKRKSIAFLMAVVMTFGTVINVSAAGIIGSKPVMNNEGACTARFVPAGTEESARIGAQLRAENKERPDLSKEPITACGNGIRPDHVRYKPWFIEEGGDPGETEKKTGDELTRDREYVEGEAVVLVRSGFESEVPTGGASDEIDELLLGSKPVMDIGSESLSEGEGFVTGGYDEGAQIRFISAPGYDTAQLIDKLNEKDNVLFAEPNYIFHIDSEKAVEGNEDFDSEKAVEGNEDLGPEESAEGDEDTETKVYPDMTGYQYDKVSENGIDVPDWNDPANANSRDVVVAIMDSGIDYDHPDLKNALWNEGLKYPELTALGGGEYGINLLANDSDGNPYDRKDNMDDNSHGTHCAGIIAAAWDGRGVSGVANGAKIMAVKIANDVGELYTNSFIEGADYLIKAKKAGVNIKVCSNSWGGPYDTDILRTTLRELGNEGILVVFSSGNESVNTDYSYYHLAEAKILDTLIFVNASSFDGEPADYSNFGMRTCNVFAPGSSILSTVPMKNAVPLPGISESAKCPDGSSAFWDFETPGSQLPVISFDEKLSLSVEKRRSLNGCPDNHLQKISGISAAKDKREVTLSFGNLLEESRPEYLTFFSKIDGHEYYGKHSVDNVQVEIKIPCKDAPDETVTKKITRRWGHLVCKLPEATDYSDLKLTLSFIGHSEDEDTLDILFDDIGFTSETLPYAYMSGTSMATPQVSGMAAVLAASFGQTGGSAHDEAVMLKSRILASTVNEDRYEDLCTQKGRVNLRRALDENTYSPVINGVEVSGTDNEILIKGHFFGSEPKVYLNGRRIPEKTVSESGITAVLPEDLPGAEYEVKVVNERGEGRTFCNIIKDAKDNGRYDRLTIPSGYLQFVPLAGLGGKMFFGAADRDYLAHIFSYEPGAAQAWREIEMEGIEEFGIPAGASVGVLNDYIVMFSGNRMAFLDVISGEFLGYAVFDDLSNSDSIALLNCSDELYMMASYAVSDIGGEQLLTKSRLCRVEMSADMLISVEPVVALDYNHSGGALMADGEGRLYAMLGRCGEVLERITLPEPGSSGNPKVEVINRDIFDDDVMLENERTIAWTALSTQEGIRVFQPASVSDNGMTYADNYLISFKDGKAKRSEKRLAYSPVYYMHSAGYNDRVYVSGVSYDEEEMPFVSVMDAKTFDNGEGIWAYTGMLSERDTCEQIEAGGEKFEISYSRYVNYTGKKHIKEGLKGDSADLRFTVSGQGTDKFYVRSIKTKNGKSATLTPKGEALEGVTKTAYMVPVLAPVKGGEKPGPADKARLKALNAYFKANPIRFDVLQRSFECSRAYIYGTEDRKNGIKNLIYADMDRYIAIKVNKKEYKTEIRENGDIVVTALPGGNFDGSVTIYSTDDKAE